VELCANKEFARCLLFADDTCLAASSLSDLQRVLDVCSQWAAEVGVVSNARKSHLLRLCGSPPGANTALPLSGQPLQWAQEATYLGVSLERSRTPARRSRSSCVAFGRPPTRRAQRLTLLSRCRSRLSFS
jgi:hypothetical protein